jgi:hypothetical protein
MLLYLLLCYNFTFCVKAESLTTRILKLYIDSESLTADLYLHFAQRDAHRVHRVFSLNDTPRLRHCRHR